MNNLEKAKVRGWWSPDDHARAARERRYAAWKSRQKPRPTRRQAAARKAREAAEGVRVEREALAEQVRQEQAAALLERVRNQPATMGAIDRDRLMAKARRLRARAKRAV